MTRLSDATVARLPAAVRRPAYNRADRGVGIVHLGIGAFHRAHQAVYTDDVLAKEGGDWAICGISLRSPDVRDRLAPQDGLYTVVEKSASGDACKVIGSVRDVIYARQSPQSVFERLLSPGTRIVSLTVTEKGYHRDPASGGLLVGDPDILHDLGNADAPRTAIGYLARALLRRRSAGVPPFTVLCCDNLPANGRSLRQVVLDFARRADDGMTEWIAENVAFPCTMVDRIVPATTSEDLDRVEGMLGVRDEGAVITEPFCQWMIEDRFPLGRPAWERAGAMLVSDVGPYELMKLRLLNGPHSALAYLGYLSGYETVAECMAAPTLRAYVEALMKDEIAPTVQVPEAYDLSEYIAKLLERFSNPGLRHRTWQIAMDGSQKLPQRLLDTIRDRIRQGGGIRRLCLAVAGWMRYVAGVDETGRPVDVRDPLATRLRALLEAAGPNAAQRARALFTVTEVFGTDLPAKAGFAETVTVALEDLYALGTKSTMEKWA